MLNQGPKTALRKSFKLSVNNPSIWIRHFIYSISSNKVLKAVLRLFSLSRHEVLKKQSAIIENLYSTVL